MRVFYFCLGSWAGGVRRSREGVFDTRTETSHPLPAIAVLPHASREGEIVCTNWKTSVCIVLCTVTVTLPPHAEALALREPRSMRHKHRTRGAPFEARDRALP